MNDTQFYSELVKKNIGVYSQEEQEKLRQSRVIIFGLGGVGGVQAILCARMGIGHVTGVDPDEFEVSNFNRQMLANVHTLGQPKAKAAEEHVKSIHPFMSTHFIQAEVDETNIHDLVKGHDLVIEAVDDMPSRVIIHRTARELGIPSVGMSGSPPNRGFVSSFFPDGVPYEEVLNIPGKGNRIIDEDLKQEVAELKKERARYSVTKGAPQEWADAYCRGEVGWIITPVRAMLIATFSFHEAVQILVGQEPNARAPKAVWIDLDSSTPVEIRTAPPEGWNYAHL
ncbi:HesA/MoeB/ThiF family protein [Hazenella coriacea]|nr:ThiF family adenylyltransferase [Hazenella coriacea]